MDTSISKRTGLHFGERLSTSKYGLKMSRETYGLPSRSQHQRMMFRPGFEDAWAYLDWMFRDEEHRQHSDLYLLVQRDRALINLDESLKYFKTLPADEFEETVQLALRKCRALKSVDDLHDFEDKEGLYMMVFDEYKQIYVGTASNLRKRIKQHWTGKKSFDRLVFGTPYDSVLPVDEFRALDTTRLFAARTSKAFDYEQNLVAAITSRFLLNRTSGGDIDQQTALIEGITRPRRQIVTEYQQADEGALGSAFDEIQQAVEDARKAEGGGSVGAALARLPHTIFQTQRKDRKRFFWSYRLLISQAAQDQDITIDEYRDYLVSMGENPLMIP